MPKGYDVDTHFNPAYDPWDQRLCVVPDGDLFQAIRSGRADVVTGTIETFTPTGLRMTDGTEIEADIIVTATGLTMQLMGGVEISVDGEMGEAKDHMVYKGCMLDGVPNFAFVVGYTNASWTLKADLVSEYVVRLLREMARRGVSQVVPVRDDDVSAVPLMPLDAGYIQRAAGILPQAGDRQPWQMPNNYLLDIPRMRRGAIDDGALAFS
ncbi:MAG: NAD(P)/FAD-dependent oxidoreductase [Myxococcales bacterium]|nr:MAG: NAD(P)/FAD-dependent oxidoreductase [Myxococcales bacterium]